MIPRNRLSVQPHEGPYLFPDENKRTPPSSLVYPYDVALGGKSVGDTSEGIMYQLWTFSYDGLNIRAQPSNFGTSVIILGAGPGVTALSGCFDANMHPVLAYTQGSVAKLYWYDSSVPGYATTELTDCLSPRVTFDDKRATMLALNDVILFYIKDGALFYRQQRDRYGVERRLCDCPNTTIRIERVSMNTLNRLQIEFIVAV